MVHRSAKGTEESGLICPALVRAPMVRHQETRVLQAQEFPTRKLRAGMILEQEFQARQFVCPAKSLVG